MIAEKSASHNRLRNLSKKQKKKTKNCQKLPKFLPFFVIFLNKKMIQIHKTEPNCYIKLAQVEVKQNNRQKIAKISPKFSEIHEKRPNFQKPSNHYQNQPKNESKPNLLTKKKYNRLTSGELLSNDRRAVGFFSS